MYLQTRSWSDLPTDTDWYLCVLVPRNIPIIVGGDQWGVPYWNQGCDKFLGCRIHPSQSAVIFHDGTDLSEIPGMFLFHLSDRGSLSDELILKADLYFLISWVFLILSLAASSSCILLLELVYQHEVPSDFCGCLSSSSICYCCQHWWQARCFDQRSGGSWEAGCTAKHREYNRIQWLQSIDDFLK